MKKTLVAAALAALAVPAAAQADRPDKRGDRSKANAEQKQDRREARQERRKNHRNRRGVGFAIAGTELSGLSVTDGRISAFSLDLIAANKHARRFLDVSRDDIRGDKPTPVPVAEGDVAKIRFVGVTDGSDDGTTVELADVLATDRVKVIGRVTRQRKGATPTAAVLDIKKIVIKRATETERDDD